MRHFLSHGPVPGFPKNRSGAGLGLYLAFVRSDPSLGRNLVVETADRRRVAVRDRNPHREPSGVKRDDFVGGLSVGMRLHVWLSIELLFATLPQFLKHKSARNGANRRWGLEDLLTKGTPN